MGISEYFGWKARRVDKHEGEFEMRERENVARWGRGRIENVDPGSAALTGFGTLSGLIYNNGRRG